jgi:putative NADPH-quinone reductase
MRVTVIDGHPDRDEQRFCHALAAAYAEGARQAGHAVRTIDIAGIEFPFLRSQNEWTHGSLPPQLQGSQEAIGWADHLVIIYPLWLGDVPALLKAFLEQIARPGFALTPGSGFPVPGPLKGKSARLIVTMGMPALVYRWYFLQHSLTSLKRNILQFIGIRPVRETIIGMVETTNHQRWLNRMRALGKAAR